MTTAAMPNRTARKSAGGTCSTRSWMRKKVEPHTAVTETSRSVASRACPAGAATAGSDDRHGDGAALGRLATGRVLEAHRAEEAPERLLDLDLEPGGLQRGAGLLQLLSDHVGHGYQHRALGDDEGDRV